MRRRASSGAMPKCLPCPAASATATATVIAPDPATLPPDEFDFATLWRHPQLLLCPDLLGADGARPCRACAGGRPAQLQGFRGRAGAALFERDLMRGAEAGVGSPRRRQPDHPARPDPRQALCLQQPRLHVGHHGADARPRRHGRKPRHLFRAHRDRRPPRLDRRCGRRQGRCLRDRLPLLAHGQAPRAEGQRTAGRRLDRLAQGVADDHLACTRRKRSGKS